MDDSFNWSSAIGPGTTNISMASADAEKKFMNAIKEMEIQMNDSIHPNRYEPAGNVSIHPTSPQGQELIANRSKVIDSFAQVAATAKSTVVTELPGAKAVNVPVAIGSGVEPHGCGSHDTPDVVSPENFLDRFTHQETTRAIMFTEVALIKAVPVTENLETFVSVVIPMTMSGRVEAIVKQRYLDVGWASVVIYSNDTRETRVTLRFP